MRLRRLPALAVLALLLAVAIAATQRFNPHPETPLEFDTLLQIDPGCDLQLGPCSLPLPGGGNLQFSIEPRPVRPIEPLQIAVQLQGVTAKEVMVDLQGMDMNMGISRFRLQEEGSGDFLGEGQLPVCIRSRMEWRAEVWLRTETQGIVVAPFLFATITPPR